MSLRPPAPHDARAPRPSAPAGASRPEGDQESAAAPQPLLRVVRGRLSDAELAAVTALLLARLAADSGPQNTVRRVGWRFAESGYRNPAGWR